MSRIYDIASYHNLPAITAEVGCVVSIHDIASCIKVPAIIAEVGYVVSIQGVTIAIAEVECVVNWQMLLTHDIVSCIKMPAITDNIFLCLYKSTH